MKKITRITLMVIPIVFSTIACYTLQKPAHNFLIPATYNLQLNSDKEDAIGNSEITIQRLNEGLHCKYTLKPGAEYPYVSMLFRKENSELFDTKGYNLHLIIETVQKTQLSSRIGLIADGFTDKKIPGSYLFYEKNVNLKKGINEIIMPLDEIVRTPSWWFINKPFTENELPSASRSNTEYIALYDVAGNNINQEKSFLISKIEIQPSYTKQLTYGIICWIFYVLVIFVFYKFKKRKLLRVLVPMDLSSHQNNEKDYPKLILDFIRKHYADPKLKIGEIAREIGLTENQVTFQLKQHTSKTFKPYINFLRIERSKKLLLESDLQVNEIAYQVGYNSAHHFIRVFKEIEKCSPSSFRKK